MTDPTFTGRVEALLSEGYGAEDIGLKLECGADLVRREITRLRDKGRLAEMFRPKVKA